LTRIESRPDAAGRLHRMGRAEQMGRAAMGLGARLFFLLRRTPRIDEADVRRAESFFLIRPEGLGDILLTLPAIQYLREMNPSARIAMAVLPQFAGFLADLGVVDEVVSLQYPRRKDCSPALFGRLLRQIAWLRGRYTIAYDFRGDERNAALGAWAARAVMGQVSRGTTFLLSATQPASFTFSRAIHNLNVVAVAAQDQPAIARYAKGYRYKLAAAIKESAAEKLKGLSGFILLHPGASRPSNSWDVGNWQELSRALLAEGRRLVFTGTPGGEARFVEEIVAGLDVRGGEARGEMRSRVRNVAGQTSCSELAALVEMADALVSPDTGIAHIAHAVGTPSVTLFGPGNELTGGYFTRINRPVFVELWCRPCRKAVCPRTEQRGECMSAITVERVQDCLAEAISHDARSLRPRTREHAEATVS
jgi:ADP-heptose:LPS heptosyltransferase